MQCKDQKSQPKAQRFNPAPLHIALSLAALLSTVRSVEAAPAIRLTATNHVPSCVTPDRLMTFLKARNPTLDPRFGNIARWYRYWGDAWRVRWDYAFYQMLLETNYLSYRRPDGKRGDVHEKQNNFAGIGATGGGVPGDRFPDVSTGVQAQIQHLVAYSGERLAQPVAPRTQLKQDDIVEQSRRLGRPVTFGDLARRWAVDRAYARSIDGVAAEFRDRFCASSADANDRPVPAPVRARRPDWPKPAGLGGPDAQKLAGPKAQVTAQAMEELPWLTKTAPATPVPDAKPVTKPKAAAKPAAPKPKPAKSATKSAVPVRTLWSRDGSDYAARIITEPAAPTPPLETDVTSPTVASLPDPAAQAAPTNDDSFLPTFRIAPITEAPRSRLGGPLPPLESVMTPKSPCRILSASYGGRKTLLVQSDVEGEMRLTALTVHDGFEKTMFETYARASAPNARLIGEYETAEEALADARTNCE
jgi:hypothetical protein